jgi:hypothetical protein
MEAVRASETLQKTPQNTGMFPIVTGDIQDFHRRASTTAKLCASGHDTWHIHYNGWLTKRTEWKEIQPGKELAVFIRVTLDPHSYAVQGFRMGQSSPSPRTPLLNPQYSVLLPVDVSLLDVWATQSRGPSAALWKSGLNDPNGTTATSWRWIYAAVVCGCCESAEQV